MFRIVLVLVWILVALATTAYGLDYYQLPWVERMYADSHGLFAPSGLIGQGYGIVGTIMILTGVTLYTARKRIAFLASFGRLKAWLEFHIFLCTLGPFLILLHTTFRFGGVVAIAFWSMAAVVVSGVFGRYVYVWIPKTVNGKFLSAQAVEETRRDLLERVREAVGDGADEIASLWPHDEAAMRRPGLAAALGRSLAFRLSRRGKRRRVMEALGRYQIPNPLRRKVVDLIEEQERLSQQGALLQPFQRMFRYWHAFHLPLAIVMMLILVVHVGVAVAFGYTWIF